MIQRAAPHPAASFSRVNSTTDQNATKVVLTWFAMRSGGHCAQRRWRGAGPRRTAPLSAIRATHQEGLRAGSPGKSGSRVPLSGRAAAERVRLKPYRSWQDLGQVPGAGAVSDYVAVRTRVPDYRTKRPLLSRNAPLKGAAHVGFDREITITPMAAVHGDPTADLATVLRPSTPTSGRSEFFWRIRQPHGLPMIGALLCLVAAHRALSRRHRVPGAGDGRTINAQVRWAPTTPPAAFRAKRVRLGLARPSINEGRVSAGAQDHVRSTSPAVDRAPALRAGAGTGPAAVRSPVPHRRRRTQFAAWAMRSARSPVTPGQAREGT